MKITGVKNITAKVFKNQKGDLIKYISKKNFINLPIIDKMNAFVS